MGDTNPLAKLSKGDMVAREVCYHESCKTAFEIAECISFIEDSLQSSDKVSPFIKLLVLLKF